jgi:hypothetical protein
MRKLLQFCVVGRSARGILECVVSGNDALHVNAVLRPSLILRTVRVKALDQRDIGRPDLLEIRSSRNAQDAIMVLIGPHPPSVCKVCFWNVHGSDQDIHSYSANHSLT